MLVDFVAIQPDLVQWRDDIESCYCILLVEKNCDIIITYCIGYNVTYDKFMVANLIDVQKNYQGAD